VTEHDPAATPQPEQSPPPIEQQRTELAETVDALTQKLDVPSRVKTTASHSIETIRRTADQNRPAVAAAAATAVAVFLLITLQRKRRNRKALRR